MTLAVRPSPLVAVDDELGPIRYCRRCDEWWPEDGEFWVIQVRRAGTVSVSRGRPYRRLHDATGYVCRACSRERQAVHARAVRAKAAA